MIRRGSLFIGLCIVAMLLLSASLAVAVMVPSGPDTSVSSNDPVQPGLVDRMIVIGPDNAGKSIEVAKAEKFKAEFLEYNNGTWRMKDSPNVKVISDFTMESYPSRHVITLEAVQSGSLHFEFIDPAGAVVKGISVEIVVKK